MPVAVRTPLARSSSICRSCVERVSVPPIVKVLFIITISSSVYESSGSTASSVDVAECITFSLSDLSYWLKSETVNALVSALPTVSLWRFNAIFVMSPDPSYLVIPVDSSASVLDAKTVMIWFAEGTVIELNVNALPVTDVVAA